MFKKIAIFAIIALVACQTDDEQFSKFLKYVLHQGKNYENLHEFKLRFEIFKSNLEFIEFRTVETLSPFMDLTKEEFSARYLSNFDEAAFEEQRKNFKTYEPTETNADELVDWRDKGVVAPIKNQGQCGSCWAFSAVSTLETQNALTNGLTAGKVLTLSEQQLVDCDTTSHGCEGGLMDNAFNYIKSNDGIETDKVYPYTAADGKCKAVSALSSAKVDTIVDLKSEKDMINAVQTVGVISVAMNANTLQYYQAGDVLKDSIVKCNPLGLNHGVNIVGVDVKEKVWIFRNSWGTGWGDKGYFKVAITGSNYGVCGINRFPSYATVVKKSSSFIA